MIKTYQLVDFKINPSFMRDWIILDDTGACYKIDKIRGKYPSFQYSGIVYLPKKGVRKVIKKNKFVKIRIISPIKRIPKYEILK